MCTCNRDFYPSNTLLFYVDLFNTIGYVIGLLLYMFLFLSIFYVYHKSSKNTFRSSFGDNYHGYLYLTRICLGRDIFNSSFRVSTCHNCLKHELEESFWKFLLLSHIDVCCDNCDDPKQDKDHYQTIYKSIHFHLRPNSKNLPKNDKIDTTNTQLSIDQVTTFYLTSTITECVSYERFKTFDQNHSDRFVSYAYVLNK
jgi:hypothetical protein